MASSKEYLEYVLDLLSGLDNIRYRYMMSEYVIYYRDKVFGGVYDDRFLIKPTKTVLERLPDAEFASPYPGGREMVVLDTEDRTFIKQLVMDMTEEIPAPKEKRYIEKSVLYNTTNGRNCRNERVRKAKVDQ